MKVLTLFLLLCSHLPLFWPCIRAVRNGRLPRSIDLVGLSLLLYFDLEIAFEALGGRYSEEDFKPMFSFDTLGLSIALLLIAPWAMKLGYLMVGDLVPAQRANTTPVLQHVGVFYALSLAVCLVISGISISLLTSTSAIWSARSFIKEYVGLYVVVFYVPTGILGFYARQPESRTKWGRAFTIALMVLAIVAIAPVGERIVILTPVLIVLFFCGKPSLKKFIGVGSALMIAGILMMQITKGTKDKTVGELGYEVFTGDLSRGPMLAASLDSSPAIGSRLLPYPGAGYVYSALYYVPRSVLPFKGYSTPTFFTARITNARGEDLDWAFAMTAIDELAVNFGWLPVPLGMFMYGIAFALLDLASLRIRVLKVTSLLSAIWLMGYSLPTLISVFGTISLFGGLCHIVFTRQREIVRLTAASNSRADYRLRSVVQRRQVY